MKKRYGGFVSGVIITTGIALCAAAISGCANQPQRSIGPCAVGGAVVGTLLGAGAGVGIEYGNKAHPSSDNTAAGAGGGAAIGAVLGFTAGHYLCDPIIPPPPPPPPQVVQAPPPPPPPPPRAREKLVLRGVHFDFDKSNIRPEDESVLDEAASTLKEQPGVSIYVDGYCDAIGSEEYNQKLSERRAGSVAAYLEDHGIPAGRLTPRGFGKTHFVASNDTADGRAENRRVELVPAD